MTQVRIFSFLVALFSITMVSSSLAQVHIEAKLTGAPKVGNNVLQIRLKDHLGIPISDAEVILLVFMPEMEMAKTMPKVSEQKDGFYIAMVSFTMVGKWRVVATIKAKEGDVVKKDFDFFVGGSGQEHKTTEQHQHGGLNPEKMSGMHEMRGKLGEWSMAREGSGTSWMPDSSPMFMKSLGQALGFDLSLMGTASLNFSDAGGRRGDSQIFSNSMIMIMARKQLGKGILGFQTMFSLDPVFNGKKGYPNLFQTGETANGQPLRDRQHPHDLIAELSASYSHSISRNIRAFLYGGPVGEPALGGPMFMHRPSGMENPEAPISHHWFDSTHISFGVLTAGLSFGNKWQVEGSWFNGKEPDENRYNIDPIRFNSNSGRVTFNPSHNWSLQLSYGFLKEPEFAEPGINQHRLTASAMYGSPLPNDSHLAATVFFGQNIKTKGQTSALGIEMTYFRNTTSFFGRLERVEKDELVGIPHGTYTINKLILGMTYDFTNSRGFDFGIGGFVGLHAIPTNLHSFYGKNPVSFGIFLRIRPSKMDHQ